MLQASPRVHTAASEKARAVLGPQRDGFLRSALGGQGNRQQGELEASGAERGRRKRPTGAKRRTRARFQGGRKRVRAGEYKFNGRTNFQKQNQKEKEKKKGKGGGVVTGGGVKRHAQG